MVVIKNDIMMVGLVIECVVCLMIMYRFVFNREVSLSVVRLNIFMYFLKGLFDKIKLIVFFLVRFVISL